MGPHDQISRATTRLALGLVRGAQGRDEEADALFVEAMEIVRATENLNVRVDMARKVARYLREHGRDAEADAYEDEADALVPVAA